MDENRKVADLFPFLDSRRAISLIFLLSEFFDRNYNEMKNNILNLRVDFSTAAGLISHYNFESRVGYYV